MINKILIVEDDEHKLEGLRHFISDELPRSSYDVAMSVSSAFRKLENNPYDLAILDMSLPSFDNEIGVSGGIPINFGGEEIIDYIDKLGLLTKVVIFTQYPKFKSSNGDLTLGDIAAQLEDEYEGIYLGAIYFNIASDTWKREIKKLLSESVLWN